MSQSQQQFDTGRIDPDDHTASDHDSPDGDADDPATSTPGAHYTCRTHDDPHRARSRGLTAGPVVRTADE
jgi:hypothetical protein